MTEPNEAFGCMEPSSVNFSSGSHTISVFGTKTTIQERPELNTSQAPGGLQDSFHPQLLGTGALHGSKRTLIGPDLALQLQNGPKDLFGRTSSVVGTTWNCPKKLLQIGSFEKSQVGGDLMSKEDTRLSHLDSSRLMAQSFESRTDVNSAILSHTHSMP